jgi:hypothetical protein
VTLPLEPPRVPEPFAAAVDGLHAALATVDRPGLVLHEIPGPRRLAPYSVAVAAEIARDGKEVAHGRLVVLHDPEGQEGWRGDTRVVAFVSAAISASTSADAALAEVGWSWLTEALHDRGAPHTAAGGTVTRTVSSRFGQLTDPAEASEVEIRASWTALPGADGRLDLASHLGAWCDLLCATAGLPPAGVASLPVRPA